MKFTVVIMNVKPVIAVYYFAVSQMHRWQNSKAMDHAFSQLVLAMSHAVR